MESSATQQRCRALLLGTTTQLSENWSSAHLKLLASSRPATNSSKRSTTPSRLRCGLACGAGARGRQDAN